MIITISGLPGAGKTTAAKAIAKKLKIKQYSMGDLRGKMAMKRGMTIDEFNALGEKEAFTDKEADNFQKKLGQKEDNFIIDGRLSFHFIPNSIKIFLTIDEKEGAKRIFLEQRKDEKEYSSVEEVVAANRERMKSDKKRYEKYYSLNPFDEKLYDLVVDTTKLSREEIVKKIVDFAKNY